MLKTSIQALALVSIFTATQLGCRGHRLFPPPGPMNQQQARAVIHDPYPLDDIAPTDKANRPPGYQKPLPEPVRNRLIPDAMPWLGR